MKGKFHKGLSTFSTVLRVSVDFREKTYLGHYKFITNVLSLI
jgi:hypothetical protein